MAKAEIDAILIEAGSTKNGGFSSIRSLAYDFTFNGESFVTQNAFGEGEAKETSILKMSMEEFVTANKDLSDDERLMVKQNLLADAYGGVNATGEATNKKLKAGLQGWLYGLVEDKYNTTDSTVKEGATGSVLTGTKQYVKRSEAKIFAQIASGEKGGSTRDFTYGGIRHDYRNGIFRNNYGDNVNMSPVQGNGAGIKDGSGMALYNELNGAMFGSTFEFLKLKKYNKNNTD